MKQLSTSLIYLFVTLALRHTHLKEGDKYQFLSRTLLNWQSPTDVSKIKNEHLAVWYTICKIWGFHDESSSNLKEGDKSISFQNSVKLTISNRHIRTKELASGSMVHSL
jgi:hypothetical protein